MGGKCKQTLTDVHASCSDTPSLSLGERHLSWELCLRLGFVLHVCRRKKL